MNDAQHEPLWTLRYRWAKVYWGLQMLRVAAGEPLLEWALVP